MSSIPKTLVVDFSDSLSASQTKVIDSLPADAFGGLEYGITFKSISPLRSKFLKITVHRAETTLKTQVHSRSGEGLNFEIDAVLNGDDAELTLKNNELFGIEISATRIII